MSEDFLKDFDVLSPPTRTAKIGGEEISFSIIPARIALKFIDFSKKFDITGLDKDDTDSFDPGMLEGILEIVATVCQKSNPKITADWLMDNVDIGTLMEFVHFVFAGMKKITSDASAGETGKN